MTMHNYHPLLVRESKIEICYDRLYLSHIPFASRPPSSAPLSENSIRRVARCMIHEAREGGLRKLELDLASAQILDKSRLLVSGPPKVLPMGETAGGRRSF